MNSWAAVLTTVRHSQAHASYNKSEMTEKKHNNSFFLSPGVRLKDRQQKDQDDSRCHATVVIAEQNQIKVTVIYHGCQDYITTHFNVFPLGRGGGGDDELFCISDECTYFFSSSDDSHLTNVKTLLHIGPLYITLKTGSNFLW